MSVPEKYNRMTARRTFIAKHARLDGAILEIGALNAPLYAKPKHDAYILDWTDQQSLIRAYPNKVNVRPVDFVISDRLFSSQIEKRFKLIIACHVVEHIPDIITWMKELAAISNEDGILFLAVPDRRYTFDRRRDLTRTSDLLRAAWTNQSVPDVGQYFDHYYRYWKTTAEAMWSQPTPVEPPHRMGIRKAWEKALAASGSYNSIHCHVFEPSSFVRIVTELHQLGLLDWQLIASADTAHGSNEFLCAFRLSSARGA